MDVFERLVEQVEQGRDVSLAVQEAVSGPDRSDDIDSEAAKLAAFRKITGEIESYRGYAGPDWITATGEKLRNADPEGMAELADLARKNRDQYVGTANIDMGGSFEMWDNVLRGINACRTEQLPCNG